MHSAVKYTVTLGLRHKRTNADSCGVTGTAMKTCSKRRPMRMKPGSVTCHTGVTQDVSDHESKLNCWVCSFINKKSVVFVWDTTSSGHWPLPLPYYWSNPASKAPPPGSRLHVNTKQVVKVCLAKM